VKLIGCQALARLGSVVLFAAVLMPVQGCAVVAVADAAVTVVATGVKVGAKVVGAAVDLVIPDKDDEKKDAKEPKDAKKD
jgi:hypothetical protein